MDKPESTPEISIIIPNLNSSIIDQTLASILSQDTEYSYEIIVVGQDKYSLVEKFDQVKFIQTANPVGAAEARNIGIQKGQGNWFLFIDSDCIAQEGWIKAFTDEFATGIKVIGGGVKTPEKPFWRLVYNLSMFYGQLTSQVRTIKKFLPTLNLLVHREVVIKVGLMDEELLRGQDVDWTCRMTLAGYKLLFKPTAAILHLPSRKDLNTLRDFVQKSGYFMIKVRYKYPEIFHMPRILKKAWAWRIGAPCIAAVTSLKIIMKTKEVRQHPEIVPYMYLQKLSWCYGAAKSLDDIKQDEL
jgi:glycosyltransferase involved in cell wall biosynthesis